VGVGKLYTKLKSKTLSFITTSNGGPNKNIFHHYMRGNERQDTKSKFLLSIKTSIVHYVQTK